MSIRWHNLKQKQKQKNNDEKKMIIKKFDFSVFPCPFHLSCNIQGETSCCFSFLSFKFL